MFSQRDEYFMRQALVMAQESVSADEVPVGAVLVLNDEIIASAHNQNISLNDPSAHAEVIALRSAGEVLGNYRIPEAELFVTIEPCLMCAGAMIHARIKRLVFGASETKAGVAHSHLQAFSQSFVNHRCAVQGGLLEEECGKLMSDFFKKRRAQKSQ